MEEGIQVVTTGAGNPGKYMAMWKEAGVKVIPVVASVALARMMEKAGADAVVAEGTESGGHIGSTSTMTLVPQSWMPWISRSSQLSNRWQRYCSGYDAGSRSSPGGHTFLCCKRMYLS